MRASRNRFTAVSEETGEVSIAVEGRFIPVMNKERLMTNLKDLLVRQHNKKKR